jgi:outer membrane lipoprotein-sorting protein
MNRRTLFIVPLLMFGLIGPLHAAGIIPLDDISAYLNKMTTAKTAFSQINPDGTISKGTLYIKRPGRMRLEYAPPSAALVMAGGGTVAIFDRKSNEPPQQFPLNRTPLSVILKRDVNLNQAKMITSHHSDGTVTTITVQDPENPDVGYIELIFTSDPVALRKWVVTDESGSQTTVILEDLETGIELSSGLFSVPAEMLKTKQSR